jgi:alpha-L-rhamnosidase
MRTTTQLASIQEVIVAPATQTWHESTLFVSFHRAAFGTLSLRLSPSNQMRTLVVHLGEKLDSAGRIDRNPPGTIRYRCIEQTIAPMQTQLRLVIPPDSRNTGPAAIKMPTKIGEVFPFRYAEIENAMERLIEDVQQIAVWYPFDDAAADFQSSSDVLNAVWDICKYTIKATTFCGVYIDGDRERIPYEGDAYINQLGHYCVDHEYDFARYSHEYMLQYPTWPTEWHMHSVMMAWIDYLYSGESKSLVAFYDILKAKTLIDFARADHLISTDLKLRSDEMKVRIAPHMATGVIHPKIRDLVDWPPGSFTEGGTGERDNHEMLPVNTVVNAFHAHVLQIMSWIAGAVGNETDQIFFEEQAGKGKARINEVMFDEKQGVYVDGEGSKHASLHSNMFMLAFNLVPPERKNAVLAFVKSRGMACSVYGAQHLLEALYLHGEADYALSLMTARHDRSWWNMIASGSTMTIEAWDLRYKNNLDWNHAWGAAPANIIPRYVLGVRPLAPGCRTILIAPDPGSLVHACGKVPTPHGPIEVHIVNDQQFTLKVTTPAGVDVKIVVPERYISGRKHEILLNGKHYIKNI